MSAAGNSIRIRNLRQAIAEKLAADAYRTHRVNVEIRPELVAELVAHLSFGVNRKLPRTTCVLNFSAATDCASKRLGLCRIPEGKCYALKAERAWQGVLPYRRRQDKLTHEMTPFELAAAVGELAQRYGIDKLRLSEAGDYRDQHDVAITNTAATLIKEHFKVVTYGYTARTDLDFGDCTAVVVNSSGDRLNGGSGNQFHAVPNPDDYCGVKCHGDCRVCQVCSKAHGRLVVVGLH